MEIRKWIKKKFLKGVDEGYANVEPSSSPLVGGSALPEADESLDPIKRIRMGRSVYVINY